MSERFEMRQFDGKNFVLWKFQMKLFLMGKELWDNVSGDTPKPVPADAAAPTQPETERIKKWNSADQKAMMYLTQGLSDGQLAKVINCNNAKAIWDRLCATHEQKDETSVLMVQQQFYEYRKDPNDDMSTHVSKVEQLARRLEDLGEKPSDNAIITKVLMTLPAAYRGLVSAWDSAPAGEKTLAKLTARLLKEEELDKNMSVHTESRTEVFMASGRHERHGAHGNGNGNSNNRTGKGNGAKTRFSGKCRHCKAKGHKEEDCWTKYPEKKPHRSGAANISASGSHEVLMASSTDGTDGWVIDSGCTEHMCANREWFSEYKPIPEG